MIHVGSELGDPRRAAHAHQHFCQGRGYYNATTCLIEDCGIPGNEPGPHPCGDCAEEEIPFGG